MWTGLLVTLVVSAGTFALNEKEWRTAVIEFYAKWTIAVNTPGHDGFWSLYTEDAIHLGDERPAMNHQEFQQYMTKRGYLPFWLYMGFVELVYSDEEMAVARHLGVSRTKEGVQVHLKGVRLYKIEDGQVKEWMGILNKG